MFRCTLVCFCIPLCTSENLEFGPAFRFQLTAQWLVRFFNDLPLTRFLTYWTLFSLGLLWPPCPQHTDSDREGHGSDFLSLCV